MTVVSINKVPKYALKEFECGEFYLDKFLTDYARQNEERGISRTFLLLEKERVVGYYTLSSAEISFENANPELCAGLPRYPLLAIRLARLAIAKDSQKKGYGGKLLKDAFCRILKIAEEAGVYFVVVDAKSQSASFYEHYGFIKMTSKRLTYLMPISTLRKAFILGNQQ